MSLDLNNLQAVGRFDRSNFAGLIGGFPEQLEEGMKIAEESRLPKWKASSFSNVAVAGLGGSAMAAEIVKGCLTYHLKIPMAIIRHYRLPDYVSEKSLVIASSYSGNTEETLSAYREARKKKARIVAVSSGGKLSDWAKKDKVPQIKIPGGMPPRAALGYSLAVLLVLLTRLGLVKQDKREIATAARFLKEFRKRFLPISSGADNPAKNLAMKLQGRIPIIYAGEDHFSAVALRWKQQICENAKTPAFSNVFPEFNHNELVGWGASERFRDKLAIIILRDRDDHQRVKARMEIVQEILKRSRLAVIEINSEGETLWERILSLVHWGDWASYYLAVLNEVDPTPIEVIDFLKQNLAARK